MPREEKIELTKFTHLKKLGINLYAKNISKQNQCLNI